MLLNNEYLNLVEIARNKRLSISLEQYNEIRKLYKDVANELKIRASKAKNRSLSQGWLKDYKKVINIKLREMDKVLQSQIKSSIEKSAEASNDVQLNFFDMLNAEYRLGMKQTFRTMFSSIPSGVVSELASGNFYKDGLGLSHRIWFTHNKVNGNIDYLIQKGIAEKKSAFDLANDVAKYVNPDFKADWEWRKVYPGTAKTVDYCAQRLARTSISHSYTLSMLRSCEINPFITKVRWHSVFSPGRTCQLCKDRDGREYLIKDCPMDHPNGMCYQEPILDDSLDNIGSRLKDWVDGNNDNELDNWYDEYVNHTSSKKIQSVPIIKSKNSDIIKADNKENSKHSFSKWIKSDIKWSNFIDIPQNISEKLNEIHSELNEFMHKNNREKLVLLNIKDNNIIHNLEGTKDDEVKLTKETKALLKNSEENSIIFAHNHPSATTFSRYDIQYIIKYKSVKALTLECVDGSKYFIDRGNLKSSFIKDYGFFSKYNDIYNRVATRYPQLEDEEQIKIIWNDFLHDVNKEIAKEYGMIYKKVE